MASWPLDRIVCVDFDATIKPWTDAMFDFPEPLPGAAEAVRALKDAGYRVVIFTSRLSRQWLKTQGNEMEAGLRHLYHIADYLDQYEIPFDDITAEKIPAAAYFDDRAVRVDPIHDLKSQVDSFLKAA